MYIYYTIYIYIYPCMSHVFNDDWAIFVVFPQAPSASSEHLRRGRLPGRPARGGAGAGPVGGLRGDQTPAGTSQGPVR